MLIPPNDRRAPQLECPRPAAQTALVRDPWKAARADTANASCSRFARRAGLERRRLFGRFRLGVVFFPDASIVAHAVRDGTATG